MRVRPSSLVSLCSLALLLAVTACGPAGGPGTPVSTANATEGDSDSEVGRYIVRSIDVRRGPPILFRFDTATGETWSKGMMEDGPWKPVAEKPGQEPEPGSELDRYYMKPVPVSRGAPNLLRVDTVTGKAWRKGARSEGPWVLIPLPGSDAEAAVKTKPLPEPKPAGSEAPAS